MKRKPKKVQLVECPSCGASFDAASHVTVAPPASNCGLMQVWPSAKAWAEGKPAALTFAIPPDAHTTLPQKKA